MNSESQYLQWFCCHIGDQDRNHREWFMYNEFRHYEIVAGAVLSSTTG